MLRVYCHDWDGGPQLPDLSAEERHHLVRVRRVRPGEVIELLNGRGTVGQARVERCDKQAIESSLLEVRQVPPPALQLRLSVALTKGKTFPALLQKAVELGAWQICPLATAHVAADAGRAEAKGERWEAVLVEALKQSGNPWLPTLFPVRSLAEHLADGFVGPRLCAALQPDARPLWDLLGDPLSPRGALDCLIGPEGDFSAKEYAQLREAGCLFASLGPLVLRVETAASLLVGCLQTWSRGSGSI